MSLEAVGLFQPIARTCTGLDPELRVVALGGGTGLPVTLRALKGALFPPRTQGPRAWMRDRLTAIVTVADDGGSSGRLRHLYGVLPPGDMRNCLLALSEGDPALRSIFDFRFREGAEIGGHSLGNLILTALSLMSSDLCSAVEQAGELLKVRGRVLPASEESITLRAHFDDGSFLDGESRIARTGRAIRRLSILPREACGHPLAERAIARADLVVIGPGSLYTSLVPILLIENLAASLARSRARVVLVGNLMTEPGETDGHTAADLVEAIRRHAPGVALHDVVLNDAPIPASTLARYAARRSSPIPTDAGRLRSLGCRIVPGDLIETGPKLRHDWRKLSRTLGQIAATTRRAAALA